MDEPLRDSKNYISEGLLAFAYGIIAVCVFSLRFYRIDAGSLFFYTLDSASFPFFVYFMFALQRIFRKKLNEQVLGWLIMIYIGIMIFEFLIYNVPFLFYAYLHIDLFEPLGFKRIPHELQVSIRMMNASIVVLVAVFCFLYESVMRPTIRFIGLSWLATGILLFIFSLPSYTYVHLTAAAGNLGLSYFFLNVKRELERFTPKKQTSEDLLDQF